MNKIIFEAETHLLIEFMLLSFVLNRKKLGLVAQLNIDPLFVFLQSILIGCDNFILPKSEQNIKKISSFV